MAETYGRVVVQATKEILDAFREHRDRGLEKLVAYACADPVINDDCDVFFEELDIKGDSGCFEFNDLYFSQTVERLAETGENIGLYLHSWSEYGSHYFLAKNPEGKQFSFFSGGPEDDFEVEGGDIITEEKLQQWLNVIPDQIKKDFPRLVNVPREG